MYLESYPAGSQWASFTFPPPLCPTPHSTISLSFFSFFLFLLFSLPIYGFREAQKTQEGEKT